MKNLKKCVTVAEVRAPVHSGVFIFIFTINKQTHIKRLIPLWIFSPGNASLQTNSPASDALWEQQMQLHHTAANFEVKDQMFLVLLYAAIYTTA